MSNITDPYAGTPYAMPPGTDLSESKQPLILVVNIAGLALATLAICLRIWARYLSEMKFGLDDYFMIPALIVGIIFFCFNTLWMVRRGLGKHIWAAPSLTRAVSDFNFGLFVLELCYTSVIVFVKFSILAFYRRIFRVDSIRWPLYVLWGIVACWGVALWTTTIFQCVPVSGFWDKTIPAKCSVDVPSFFLGNSIPNIITDVALMVPPLPYIYKLHLRGAQKIALAGVFALGTFVAVISATRLVFVMHLDLTNIDIMWNFIDTEVWSTLEIFIAMICACLPSLRPVLALIFHKTMSSRSRSAARLGRHENSTNLSTTWGALRGSQLNRDKMSGNGDEDKDRLFEMGHGGMGVGGKDGSRTTVTGGSERTMSDDDVELGHMRSDKGVLVTTDIRMEWESKV